MAQLLCIGLSWPLTKAPFGSWAISFHYGVWVSEKVACHTPIWKHFRQTPPFANYERNPCPKHSMYCIFTYIWLIFMVNVGKYIPYTLSVWVYILLLKAFFQAVFQLGVLKQPHTRSTSKLPRLDSQELPTPNEKSVPLPKNPHSRLKI